MNANFEVLNPQNKRAHFNENHLIRPFKLLLKINLSRIISRQTNVYELHFRTINWICVLDMQVSIKTVVLNGLVGQCLT